MKDETVFYRLRDAGEIHQLPFERMYDYFWYPSNPTVETLPMGVVVTFDNVSKSEGVSLDEAIGFMKGYILFTQVVSPDDVKFPEELNELIKVCFRVQVSNVCSILLFSCYLLAI